MDGLRLGDDVDDFCIKCKRVTNHFILAMVGPAVAKVRCRTCYNEQEFRSCVPLPPRPRSVRKTPDPAPVSAETDVAAVPAAGSEKKPPKSKA